MERSGATARPDPRPFAQVLFPFGVPEGMRLFTWRWRDVESSSGLVAAPVCPNCRCPEDEHDPWGMVWSSERPGFIRCAVCGCDIYGDDRDLEAYYKPTPGGMDASPYVRPGSCRADR